ncbi:TetR/AcrR family transcriptional regulator [Petrocella sp. FN5]|uniref:TetR/AcrR family transcriptional regulator n=1 Tax=Petrocella sp. FN5 TaxID=3032002 RepID=UPI0023DBE213|nr:TetR/AcrR family transcriptional regulator [Petrocella sp. FN5]MDF1617450.1 TetR/AcrR family transcriptional regulator [Petrocella sp. FN5]
MQILKDDQRTKIHQAAIDAFIRDGYQKASMRGIAESAGMSVGNLYRYFKNKEDLFAHLVKPLIEVFLACEDQPFKPQLLEVNILENSAIMDMIMNARIEYRQELFILFLRAEGSPYEGAKDRLKSHIEEQSRMLLEELSIGETEIIKSRLLITAVSTAMVESFCIILEEAKDDKEFIYSLLELTEFGLKPALRNLIAIKNKETNFRRINDEEVREFCNHFNHHSRSHCT